MLAKLAGGYDGLIDEANFLFSRVISFKYQAIDSPDWLGKDKEYQLMNDLDYSKVRNIYKALFAPNDDAVEVLKRKPSSVEEYKVYTEFTKHLGRRRISLLDFRAMIEARKDIANAEEVTVEELRTKISLEDVTDYRNTKQEQIDKRNYLAICIFSNKYKDSV